MGAARRDDRNAISLQPLITYIMLPQREYAVNMCQPAGWHFDVTLAVSDDLVGLEAGQFQRPNPVGGQIGYPDGVVVGIGDVQQRGPAVVELGKT